MQKLKRQRIPLLLLLIAISIIFGSNVYAGKSTSTEDKTGGISDDITILTDNNGNEILKAHYLHGHPTGSPEGTTYQDYYMHIWFCFYGNCYGVYTLKQTTIGSGAPSARDQGYCQGGAEDTKYENRGTIYYIAYNPTWTQGQQVGVRCVDYYTDELLFDSKYTVDSNKSICICSVAQFATETDGHCPKFYIDKGQQQISVQASFSKVYNEPTFNLGAIVT